MKNSHMPSQSKLDVFRGIWHSIHVTGASVKSPEQFKWACQWIRDQIENLPCEDCRNHAKEYLKGSPPEKSEDLFIWTWQFHNAVNHRLGKREMEYATARDLYLGGGVKICTDGCGSSNKEPTAPDHSYRSSRY